MIKEFEVTFNAWTFVKVDVNTDGLESVDYQVEKYIGDNWEQVLYEASQNMCEAGVFDIKEVS